MDFLKKAKQAAKDLEDLTKTVGKISLPANISVPGTSSMATKLPLAIRKQGECFLIIRTAFNTS